MCYGLFSVYIVVFFFFKQKTAYEMRISDWSSDVCSSDLPDFGGAEPVQPHEIGRPPDAEGIAADGKKGIAPEHGQKNPRVAAHIEIGRASCRESVCQYV